MKKNKLFILILPILFLFSPLLASAQGPFEYDPMEFIPGFGKTGDFCTYLDYLYRFGIVTVSICAVLMIIVGGFVYSTSASNKASTEKAKGIIGDALLGLVLAMSGWLLLWIINPDLVVCKLPQGLTPAGGNYGEQIISEEDIVSDDEFEQCENDARADLASRGINIKANACSYQGEAGCTAACKLPASAIAGLEKIKGYCGDFVVTGGTEGGHKSHGPGIPNVDLRRTDGNTTLGDCIKDHATDIPIKCLASDDPDNLNYGCTFADGSDHWHVEF